MNLRPILILLFAYGLLYAAVETDFRKGVDLTGRSSVSPSQLNQLVDNATLNTNKGLVIVQATEPDLANNSRYAYFLWVDTSVSGFPTLKFYNGTVWTNSLIGATITTTNLADGSVTTPKLASGAVTSDKVLNGAIGSLQLGGSSVTADKIAVGVVLRTHLSDGAVSTEKITNSAVTGDKIADGTITSGKIATINAATITNLSAYATLANPVLYLTNLPPPTATNQILLSHPDGLTWTNTELAQIIYAGTTETNAGTIGGIVIQKPHTLGRNPYYMRVTFEVTNTFCSYDIGDEIDISAFQWSSGATRVPFLHSSCNSTAVYLRADYTYYRGGANTIKIPDGVYGLETNINPGIQFPTNSGQFKFYVR